MVRNEKKEMTAGEIADKICEIAPEALQETWDNSGFLAGSRKHPVTKVLTCLDLDFSVLKEAERLGCEDRNASSVTVFGDQKTYG